MSTHDTSASRLPRRFPLVGRADELDRLYRLFGDADAVEQMAILKGDGGVGKSRLAETVGAEAERRGWSVVRGRAYPVETGAPFALISDAFVPMLRAMDEDTLTVLARGEQAELRRLLPALGPAPDDGRAARDPSEEQTRLFWHFADLLRAFAERTPLLIVLEDLHWADPSSLALIHFLVRQSGEAPIRVLATCNTQYRDAARRLLPLERSLVSLRRLQLVPLDPLSREDTTDLLEQVFDASGGPIRDFADVLYGWTRGNPFFIEETLGALVESGRIHRRDGVWLGWDARELELPGSIRDAILTRLAEVPEDAVGVADALAVVGAPAEVALLEHVTGQSAAAVADAVEALERRGLVEARGDGGRVEVRYRHPLGRETVLQEISAIRLRALHRDVADALEATAGADAPDADEIAYHLVQAGASRDEPRTIRYLTDAGRAALARHADAEAVAYLERAEAFLTSRPTSDEGRTERPGELPPLAELRRDLVRALARTGRYAEAEEVGLRLLATLRATGDPEGVARALRRLGLVDFWQGRHEAALDRFAEALDVLGERAPALRARIHANSALALQELGRSDDGRREVRSALELATELDDVALLGRVHRGLALLATFTGHAAEAREHAHLAVEYGDRSGDAHVAFWGRWVLASLEGLSGGPVGIEAPLREAREAADALRNPVFGLWVTELEVELGYFGGDWDRALAIGERGITRAADLHQRALEVRILVWTATCYLGRGDIERGRTLVERACRLAGLEHAGARKPDDIHALVPAYIGCTALAMAEGDYEEAVRLGSEGLALADRVGYSIWIVHRLLPLIGEAHIRLLDLEGAAEVERRLREEGGRMENRVALSYAATARALVAWHGGRIEEAVGLLTEAAEELESIGFIPEAARIRRQLAGRLAEVDRVEDALAELRRVHEVFGAIGARPELEKARGQFRELDARPPSRSLAEGAGELTGRETEVAALVADRKSNKAIARALGVSPRTVTTHLSNIYRKLEIGSRGELVDMVREGRLRLDAPSGD